MLHLTWQEITCNGGIEIVDHTGWRIATAIQVYCNGLSGAQKYFRVTLRTKFDTIAVITLAFNLRFK